jgi:hypothetical protein
MVLVFCRPWPASTLFNTRLAGHKLVQSGPKYFCSLRSQQLRTQTQTGQRCCSFRVFAASCKSQTRLRPRFLHPHNITPLTQRRQASPQSTAEPCYQHRLLHLPVPLSHVHLHKPPPHPESQAQKLSIYLLPPAPPVPSIPPILRCQASLCRTRCARECIAHFTRGRWPGRHCDEWWHGQVRAPLL